MVDCHLVLVVRCALVVCLAASNANSFLIWDPNGGTFRVRPQYQEPVTSIRSAHHSREVIYHTRSDGYDGFRIPAIVITNAKSVLAFCEGRKHNLKDNGHIDIVYRRSIDGGETWSNVVTIASDPGYSSGNPAPVIDRRTGVIILIFSRNHAWEDEKLIRARAGAPRSIWMARSSDDGVSWTHPVQITDGVRGPSWTWYATGPGHGIQLRTGRLVIACNHADGLVDRSHIIYSDDGGATWHLGGSGFDKTNEATVVENPDGSLYMNSRHRTKIGFRFGAWSYDQGMTFAKGQYHTNLPEPNHGCHASMLRVHVDGQSYILLANPASRENKRHRLTLKISGDDGKTWQNLKLIYGGDAAYSDMAQSLDGTYLFILWEKPWGNIILDRIDLRWLLARKNVHAMWEQGLVSVNQLAPTNMAMIMPSGQMAPVMIALPHPSVSVIDGGQQQQLPFLRR